MFWSVNEIILTTKDQNIPNRKGQKCSFCQLRVKPVDRPYRQVGSQDKSLCLPQLTTTNYYQPLFLCWPLGNSDHQTGKQKRPGCTAHHQKHDIGSKGSQFKWALYSLLERVFWIQQSAFLMYHLVTALRQCSDICSYLPRYLRNACASREGCDGRWGAGLGRGGRRGGQRQRHPSHDRHHDHGQKCHLDNHYHHQVDFSVREHTERSKAVWSTASFQLKLVRTIFFL